MAERRCAASLFLVLAASATAWFNALMRKGYGQFCPIAKASEIFATRWTPLVLRELMADIHSFNDIHRGVPLISRAVLVARLRDLEDHEVIERRSRPDGTGHVYWLTPAGEALRPVVAALGLWGLAHTRDRIKSTDLDPVLDVGFRKTRDGAYRRAAGSSSGRAVRVLRRAGEPYEIPRHVAVARTPGRRCLPQDPGFAIDLICRGNIADFVAIYLGHAVWRDVAGKAISIEGDRQMARQLPAWLRLDKVPGRDFPVVRPAA